MFIIQNTNGHYYCNLDSNKFWNMIKYTEFETIEQVTHVFEVIKRELISHAAYNPIHRIDTLIKIVELETSKIVREEILRI